MYRHRNRTRSPRCRSRPPRGRSRTCRRVALRGGVRLVAGVGDAVDRRRGESTSGRRTSTRPGRPARLVGDADRPRRLPCVVNVIYGGVLSTWNSTPSFMSVSGASGLSRGVGGRRGAARRRPSGSCEVSKLSWFSSMLSRRRSHLLAPLLAERERVAERVAVVVVRAPGDRAIALAEHLLSRLVLLARLVEAGEDAVLVGVRRFHDLRRRRDRRS